MNKLKYISLLLSLHLLFCAFGVSAENYFSAETVPFNVVVNGENLNNKKLEYPVFFMEEIIYLPLTYFNLNLVGINIEVDKNVVKIDKSKALSPKEYVPYPEGQTLFSNVSLCPFDIIVEKEKYNKKENYPILFYNDIIYLPLTWDIIVDRFGWEYVFDDTGFKLFTDGYFYTSNGDSYITEDEEGRKKYHSVENRTYYKNNDVIVMISTKTNRMGPIPSNMVIRRNGEEIKVLGYTGYYQKNGPLFTVNNGYVFSVHYSDPDERKPRLCKISINTGEIEYFD